jgi:hypothetical protein
MVFADHINPPLSTYDEPKGFIEQKADELILSLLDPPSGDGYRSKNLSLSHLPFVDRSIR